MQKVAALAIALAGMGTISGINYVVIKKKAFAHARSLVARKGIINLGAGPHNAALGSEEIATAPEVVANVDIVPDGLPNLTPLDLEVDHLPWPDKEFDCAFMSHILEHLTDWEYALTEAIRVADHVIVALPHPLSVSSWFNPLHKQHFSLRDMRSIEAMYPSVTVFC